MKIIQQNSYYIQKIDIEYLLKLKMDIPNEILMAYDYNKTNDRYNFIRIYETSSIEFLNQFTWILCKFYNIKS